MIVVTGATGNVGRPLVRALATAGAEVTAVARSIAEPDAPPGVRRVRADLGTPQSLRPALDGASALFLLTPGQLLAAGGGIGGVLAEARRAGVPRIVLLSSQGVATGRHAPALEHAVRTSGAEWTVLRPSGFHSNVFLWTDRLRTERVLAAPFGDVALPTVDPADVAEAAARVLLEPGHAGAAYELTGPAPVSPRQQAAAIGDALGEPVRFAARSREEARAALIRLMPAPVADITLDILGAPVPAELRVSPDAERLLGRAPRDFAAWATEAAAAFR